MCVLEYIRLNITCSNIICHVKVRHFHVYFQSSEGHIRKTKYRSYKHENIVEALALVKEGNTIYKAAKMTGVPRQTLSDRVLGHVSAEKTAFGS